MTKPLNLIVILFLTAGAAQQSFAQTYPALEALGAEMAEAENAGSLENARLLSSKVLDGASCAGPELRLESAQGQSSVVVSTASAAQRGSIAAKVPKPAHTPPVYRYKQPGVMRLLVEMPFTIVSTPIALAVAGYYLASRNNRMGHHHTAATASGILGGALGVVAGLLLAPLVMAVCLKKALQAMRSRRW